VARLRRTQRGALMRSCAVFASAALLCVVLCSAQDIAEILTQLASLKAQGLLSAEEFAAAKSRALLGGVEGLSGTASQGVQNAVGAEAIAAVVASVFGLDSVARILSLRRAQILLWGLGILPCLAFALALRVDEAPTGLPDTLGRWVGRVKADPVDVALHDSGQWAIRALVGCLAITPLKAVTRKFDLLHPLRQTLGLLSFAYSAVHAALYVVGPDQLGVVSGSTRTEVIAALETDLNRRPYIAFGIVGTLIMLLLAITSYDVVRKRMGRWWGRLHKATYIVAVVAGAHVFQYQYMRPSLSIMGAYAYPAALGLLLAWRINAALRPRLHRD
jgi:sulfoxide reductase heme-binding subunit YedZ